MIDGHRPGNPWAALVLLIVFMATVVLSIWGYGTPTDPISTIKDPGLGMALLAALIILFFSIYGKLPSVENG